MSDPSRLLLLTRRELLGVALGSACSMAHAQSNAGGMLPPARALNEELGRALQQKQALVVMVSLEGCPFCKVVRENYLGPMRERDGLPVVQVDMRSKQRLTELRGNTVTHDDLTRTWGVKVAPTVLFFGPDGTEVAERLVGGYIPDFYGAYLEDHLQTARAAVKKKR